MKKLAIVLAIFTSMLFLTACDNNKTNTNNNVGVEQSKQGQVVSNVLTARVGDLVFDEQGRKYKKLTDELFNAVTGRGTVDVWERVDPLDKTRWYTPSLGSKTFLDQPATFNSLYRLPGEDVPAF